MKRTKQERLRLGIIALAVVLFFTLVAARLVQLQVINGPRYSEIVKRQSGGTVEIPAERGIMYDRRGQVVAENVIASSIYAYPTSSRQVNAVGSYLDRLFGYAKGTAAKKFSLRTRRFRWIDRTVTDELAARVASEAPEGLYIREESRRSYPFGLVGKQILGFTDIDNRGRSGLELSFESQLAGESGIADIRRDGLRNTYRVQEAAAVRPVPGQSLVLTVDWRLQDILEDELRQAIEAYNAEHAMAAFVDCRTGDILAIAHVDPGEKNPERPMKLRAVTDWFEPGSTFKTFVAAGVLDAGIIDFNDSVFCEDGKWKIGRRTLHDDKELGWIPFRQVIELSSNIGMGKYAIELGGDEVVAACRRFGFGQKLRTGLPGESAGRLVPPTRWSDYTIACLAMGHSVAVNALQMAAAFGAVANGGELLRPRIIRGYVDESGQLFSYNERDVIGRAMKESSVDSLQAFLRGVVEHGTATKVNSPLVKIAGKTGTGEIPNLETGRMYKNRFTASFGGYFPADNPLIAGIVVITNPRPVTYGGHTAGPAFRKIAERYVTINPDMFSLPERTLAERDESEDDGTTSVPDLIGRDIALAEDLAARRGVKLHSTAAEGTVVWQFPPADRLLFEGDAVFAEVVSANNSPLAVPDFTGLSVRTVSAFMHRHGINFRVEGRGRVVEQSLKPGSELTNKSLCRLTCRPS